MIESFTGGMRYYKKSEESRTLEIIVDLMGTVEFAEEITCSWMKHG